MDKYRIIQSLVLIFACQLIPAMGLAADSASGTMVHRDRTVELQHAYLVLMPDIIDPKKTIRSLVLSGPDIGDQIKMCKVSSCVAGAVTEGLTIDFIMGPRLGFWMAINNARSQHSGTLERDSLRLSVDVDRHLVGKLKFDKSGSGGPRVEVEFDAAVIKEFTATF